MSDTPRTDAASRMAFSGEYMVEIEEAQKLERELAESKKNGCDTCDAFTLANRQLREDVVNLAKQIDPYEREAAKAAINVLKRELAEITKQRNKLIEGLKDCENYLKPHEKGVCDEESDESGWILLCHIRLILAEIKRKKL